MEVIDNRISQGDRMGLSEAWLADMVDLLVAVFEKVKIDLKLSETSSSQYTFSKERADNIYDDRLILSLSYLPNPILTIQSRLEKLDPYAGAVAEYFEKHFYEKTGFESKVKLQ